VKLYTLRNILYAGLVSSMLIGCSSDDSASGPVSATIDSENAEDLATAGTEAVKQGVNSDSLNIFGARIAGRDPLKQLSAATAQVQPMAEEIAGICEDGFVDSTGTSSGGTITYNDCVIAGAIFNGSATFSSSTAGNVTTFSISYSNFTVTFDGETTSVSASITCTTDSAAGTTSCSYDSTAAGIDGRTYVVSDMSVSGSSASGWTVSATVVDPDHGEVTITTTIAVNFGSCANGQPESGTITVSDGTNEMTVTYNDCASFSVDFDGSTTTYNW